MKKTEEKINRVYEYVKKYSIENGFPPSVREICAELSIKSTASCYDYLEKLKEKGFITKVPDKKRAVRLAETPKNYKTAPLIGTVTAGQPILAIENFENYYPIPDDFGSTDSELFLLRVNGESMIEAGIFDGDKIIVKKQESADNGDIIVALLDDSCTVKRFFVKNGQVILHPENSTMSDIYPENLQIIGKVLGLYRKF